MLYRKDRKGEEISQLGFGCMRFQRKGSGIDYAEAEKEIMYAIENGVNYFDTAYLYPGSEECLGKVLENNKCRDKVKIATKLPQYLVKKKEQIDSFFEEELSRLKTDHIDYYLMHMITDINDWERLKSFGIEEWIEKKKASGQIINLGFSFHGSSEMFIKVLEAYDWDFCQIQYNYLDEYSQAGRIGLDAAYEKGIPVIIMEPLRGGKLVNLPGEAIDLMKDEFTPASLGLKWLWNQPGVTVILSGMNSMDMVKENIETASSSPVGCMSDKDTELVAKVKDIVKANEKVGCTGCRYCMPCPKGVDIPGTFYYYNLVPIQGKHSTRVEYAQNIGLRKEPCFASQCIKCGACEKHCPQALPIREKLAEADKALRPWPYKVGLAVVRKVLKKN
ncbi:MAG: aldo/keto reductase [Lachnospiraceae bacterium]|nr:aldo/keto reductase [Candidatus Colinaster scatohippi]